jgi:hypothetical protein
MKEINLTRGFKTQVDDLDYPELNQWKWRVEISEWGIYAVRTDYSNGEKKNIRMNRVILGLTDPKIQGEHKDRNGLNNQRSNLRPATNQQNSINQVGCNKSSQYKGVFFDKSRGKFAAQIKINYKSTFIGRFISEIEAALAYDKKAKEVFGEFAYLNFQDNAKIIKDLVK